MVYSVERREECKMQQQTKIDIFRWQDNVAGLMIMSIESKLSRRPSAWNSGYDFDEEISRINQQLEQTPFISRINVQPINTNLRRAVEDMNDINLYINGLIQDIHNLVDNYFFQAFNNNVGILESLEHSNLYNYQIENNLGFTTTSTHVDQDGNLHEVTTNRPTIGLNDLMNNDILNDAHGIPSFSQMFQSQFDGIPSTETLEALLAEQEAELARLNQMLADHPYMAPDIEGQIVQLRQQMDEATMMIETFDGMTFDGFVQMLLTSGDVIHTVDRGILNMLGDLADIFGITSILGWITGTNVFTGETLTSAERDAARFNAIIAIASLAASFTGAGLAKKAGRGFVSTLAADLGSTALGGVAGIATAGILDDLDAPPWLQGLLSTGVALGVGYGSNRAFSSWAMNAETSHARIIWRHELSNEHRNLLIAAGFTEEKFAAVMNNPNFFDQLTGRPVWPGTVNPNTGLRNVHTDGFLNGRFNSVDIPQNTVIDRFGNNHGTFFAQDGLSIDQRAMSPLSDFTTHNRYVVTTPLPAREGVAASWFDMSGGGVQFQLDPNFVSQIREIGRLDFPDLDFIDVLIELEYLIRLP